MAEIQRGSNGKFAKSTGGEPQQTGTINPANGAGEPATNTGGDKITVDPAAIDASADSDRRQPESKRGRGRPAGSGNKEKTEARPAAQGKLDLDSLNFTLFYAHATLAKATKTPEIALDEVESKNLATAAMNVMQHYNIKASQKAIDWGNLLLAMTLVYGGKFHAVAKRHEAENKARKEQRDNANQQFGIVPGSA